MSVSETAEGANERFEPADSHGGAISTCEASPVPCVKVLLAALVVGLAAGVAAWSLADTFRVSEVVQSHNKFGGAYLSVPLATQNGVVASAVLGAILSLGLGLTAGLLVGRGSNSRVVFAGLAGAVLGACGSAASAYLLHPLYYNNLEEANLTRSLLVHLGVWAAVGAAAGCAFGIGSGNRSVFVQSLVGGIAGAALATLLFDIAGAFLPEAHTEKALAAGSGIRLTANLVLAVCVAVGIVVVASQKPRVPAIKA